MMLLAEEKVNKTCCTLIPTGYVVFLFFSALGDSVLRGNLWVNVGFFCSMLQIVIAFPRCNFQAVGVLQIATILPELDSYSSSMWASISRCNPQITEWFCKRSSGTLFTSESWNPSMQGDAISISVWIESIFQ